LGINAGHDLSLIFVFLKRTSQTCLKFLLVMR
jgi:hypothetical protein